MLEEDRRSRERALELGSFIVEAPAGAGKTELLTQRYLRLLAVVAEPEEIVAITFTNKAAAEMRNRILVSLERAAAGEEPPAAHQRITYALARQALAAGANKGERGWQLIAQPARLRILTIDALCASLARQLPFLSRFGVQPKISDDPQRHYEEAARRTIALLDEEGAVGEAVAEALRHLDNDAQHLAKLLTSMLARRDQWLRHTINHGTSERSEESANGLIVLVQRDLACAAEHLGASLQSRLMPAARYAAANSSVDSPLATLFDWNSPLPASSAALPQWRALCELLLTKEGTLRKQYTKNNGLPPGKESAAHKQTLLDCLAGLTQQQADAIARIRKLPDPRYSEEEWRTVAALAVLLKLAAAQLWTVFNEQGEADFVEVAQRALLALGDEDAPSDLALQLDYRIQHLLVDEFQDTSPTQVQLLQRLTNGWQEGDGRTLFAVGDPMQSIYRFRKADVGLFLRAADVGIGRISLQRLRLCRNNRSCAALVDWVNRSFAGIFPAQDSVTSGAIQYRSFFATREQPGAHAGVQVHAIVLDQATSAEEAGVLEAQRILEIIAHERTQDPTGKIVVLVRARSHLDSLVALIRREQPELHFAAVEIEGLAARQTVQDLLALTRALLHRADRVNWLAILRAPWCGLKLADLHALAADDQTATLWQLIGDAERLQRLSSDGRQRLAHLYGVLAEAFAQQGRVRLRRWLEGVWLKLGGAACLQGPAEIADAQAFFDLLDELETAGRFRRDRLEQEVAALYAAPDAQAGGMLQFMTIHKAKGLEFDCVILPGLQRKGRSDEHELMLWEEVALEGLSEQLVAAPLRKRSVGNTGGNIGGSSRSNGGSVGNGVPSPYDYLRLLEQERSANEAARVLYVAATRAIRSLHLVGVAKTNDDGEPVRPSGTFLDLLWASVAGDFAAAAADVDLAVAAERAADQENRFVPKLVRVSAPAVAEILQRAATLPQPDLALRQLGAAGEQGADALDPLAASIGTLVHVYLEMIARGGVALWSKQRLDALQAAMALWLVQRGHNGAAAKQGALQVATILQITLASVAGRWVLQSRPDSAAELAVVRLSGECGHENVDTHIVDRCFVENGQRWIIDYKTTQLDDADAVLPGHVERYRAQLERYASLFADEGLPQRLAIFYAAHGRLVELADLPTI